jgi:cytochrome c biogenesis protein CcdA/thiol-disulfide isomerase/thioredoxin
MDMINLPSLGLALLEGIGLILSPCILPILPLMLAGSLDGGRARPVGIVTGFIAAFTLFALLLRQALEFLNVDSEIVRYISLGLLAVFGLLMLSKTLSDRLLSGTQGLANFGQNLSARWDNNGGFWSGVGIGALIGLIWTPCAGPIMAAAVVQIIQAKNSLEASLTVLMFALGAGIPMLMIALTGRKIMNRLSFFKQHSTAFRRGLGVVIIATAALIYSGADMALLAAAGGGNTMKSGTIVGSTLQHSLANPYQAPEITGGSSWINSTPLTSVDLRGKVVLVDFWTYSCINCVRTLPYVTKWYDKYKDQEFVVLGVHSPEFGFEKKLENVQTAVTKHGIHYPVVLDNDFTIWNSFKNRYWPAHYLINREGRVVYEHFGEGNYDITEGNIRALLGITDTGALEPTAASTTSAMQTPETYLGYARVENFGSAEKLLHDAASSYTFPAFLPLHHWALQGDWQVGGEHITARKAGTALRMNFQARKVFLVLGTADGKPVNVRVLLNGQPAIIGGGKDVKDGVLSVTSETLYELIDQGDVKNGQMELQADAPGVQAYAFTFGS